MSTMKKAVFPGSFDPITRGHMNILERSIPLFDEVVVAVGVNSAKTSMFSMEKALGLVGAGDRGVSVGKCAGI
jgi:pantetheine-phosphate adenylyltransferase